MVVMGARDKGSLRSALLGSVSHELLHAAQVPVMLIKPRDEDASEALG
jgi:nucleotide-binding universal stress UspA family protein